MKFYIKYLFLPFLILLFFSVQLGLFFFQDEPEELYLSGTEQISEVLMYLSQRVGLSSNFQDSNGKLIVIDEPFFPLSAGDTPAGPFDGVLDVLQADVARGGHVVLGFHALSGTENTRLLKELEYWSGVATPAWIGTYVYDLQSEDVPFSRKNQWELQEGRPWTFKGPGIVLRTSDGSSVVVLRRGIELARSFFTVQGDLDDIQVNTLFAQSFVIPAQTKMSSSVSKDILMGNFGLLPDGKQLFSQWNIPEKFPVLSSRQHGNGVIWSLGLDVFDQTFIHSTFSLLPKIRFNAARTLDEPSSSFALASRLVLPLWKFIGNERLYINNTQIPQVQFRAGTDYLEKRLEDGTWEPWFVKGINLGPAIPGRWFTDPPTEEQTYWEWFELMDQTGFDSVRIYTLLPPAFYRALLAWNQNNPRPLYLIQEIWPEEYVPNHDLGDPGYLAQYKIESDFTIDALFGKAEIPERDFRAWGNYRADVSPWLAAVLIGRELEPFEVLATQEIRPNYVFQGKYFQGSPGFPVESILMYMGEVAAERILFHGTIQVPLGFVSWPTLDTLYHPAEWSIDSQKPPFNDQAQIDFRKMQSTAEYEAGFFAAFHIYPNYPDFMIRSKAYNFPDDSTGKLRYKAYISDLLTTLEGIPLLVAEFGLSTGYATAHFHPEGLDHGGLSEQAQAEGLVDLFLGLSEVGTTGGIVFQWADEWAKKTWTTEPYMIPYDRNPQWHNIIDPEQNYGIMAWEDHRGPELLRQDDSVKVLRDSAFLIFQIEEEFVSDAKTIHLGISLNDDLGDNRLYPFSPLGPQYSEFKIRLNFNNGNLDGAWLFVQPEYNRGGGRLLPRKSSIGGFTRILTLVNAESNNMEGGYHPALWEDGSKLLVSTNGMVEIRIPWSRLNFSDPSTSTILFDSIRDSRVITSSDQIQTRNIEVLKLFAIIETNNGDQLYWPDMTESFSVELLNWQSPDVIIFPKKAQEVLSNFLNLWEPQLNSPD